MKQVIDYGAGFGDGGMWVPKAPGNADYERLLHGLEDGTIVLIDPPEPELTPEYYRRAAEGYILKFFSVLELMDMQMRLALDPENAGLGAVLMWVEGVKSEALTGRENFAETAGEPPLTYLETL